MEHCVYFNVADKKPELITKEEITAKPLLMNAAQLVICRNNNKITIRYLILSPDDFGLFFGIAQGLEDLKSFGISKASYIAGDEKDPYEKLEISCTNCDTLFGLIVKNILANPPVVDVDLFHPDVKNKVFQIFEQNGFNDNERYEKRLNIIKIMEETVGTVLLFKINSIDDYANFLGVANRLLRDEEGKPRKVDYRFIAGNRETEYDRLWVKMPASEVKSLLMDTIEPYRQFSIFHTEIKKVLFKLHV